MAVILSTVTMLFPFLYSNMGVILESCEHHLYCNMVTSLIAEHI